MSSFSYKALESDGSLTEGTIEGASRGEALRKVEQKGLQLVSITELEGRRPPKSGKSEEKAEARPVKEKAVKKSRDESDEPVRLNSKQLIQFTEEMSDMLSAGLQLDSALESIAKRSESDALRDVASACYERVREGMPLAGALRASSKSFSTLYCNLVSAGEVSGALDDILKRQVKYLNTLVELKGQLITAMIYPAFLVASGVGVTAMFMFFLIPKLEKLVESTGGSLPPIAKFMLNFSEFLKDYWMPLILVFLVLIGLLVWIMQDAGNQRRWHEIKLKLPLFGKLLRTQFNVQFVETMSNLLNNGMPLVRSLQLVQGTSSNLYLQEQIEDITGHVSEGSLLYRSMERTGAFDSGLVDMVRIGEDTGNLAVSMTKAGDRLDREFKRSIDRLGSVIQPLIILLMSVIVGIMAYMMISVIYETISVLQNR